MDFIELSGQYFRFDQIASLYVIEEVIYPKKEISWRIFINPVGFKVKLSIHEIPFQSRLEAEGKLISFLSFLTTKFKYIRLNADFYIREDLIASIFYHSTSEYRDRPERWKVCVAVVGYKEIIDVETCRNEKEAIACRNDILKDLEGQLIQP